MIIQKSKYSIVIMKRWNDELLHTCNKVSGVLCWDHCSTAFASSPEHRSCQKKVFSVSLWRSIFILWFVFLFATVNSEFSPWMWAGNNLRVATVLGCVCRTEPEKEDDISCCFFLSLLFVWIWSKLCLKKGAWERRWYVMLFLWMIIFHVFVVGPLSDHCH